MKRERAIAYANSHQWRPESNGGSSQVYFNNEGDKPHWGWSWLERWMAARPWENRPLKDAPDRSPTKVAAENQDDQLPQSYMDESPTQSQALHQSSDNTSKQTSPITSTLMQLQRQQRQMLRGCNDQAESDASSTPCSNSHTPSNSENIQSSAVRRSGYMAATKSAQAKARAYNTPNPKQRTPDDGAQSKAKRRTSLPTRESRDSTRSTALSMSPSNSQATSRNSSGRGDKSHHSGESGSQPFPKPSSRRSDASSFVPEARKSTRRSPGDFMSASYNMDRGSRKASDILASAYKASGGSRKGAGDFMHQSYNFGRPTRRHGDFMTSSYNQDRPRRSAETRQSNLESATKKNDFLAHYNAQDKSTSRKDILSKSLNYEKPTQKKSSSNTVTSDSVSQSNHRSSQQPKPSRRSGEYSRSDRPTSRAVDALNRSYQSERPPFGHSADFTSHSSVHGDFWKPIR